MPRFRMLSEWWPLLWLLLFVFVGVAFLAAHLAEQRRRTPFWDKYQKVRLDMTAEEVKSILGPPTLEEDIGSFGPTTLIWIEGEQRIFVFFMPEDCGEVAVKKGFLPKSLWEKLRDLAHSSVIVSP